MRSEFELGFPLVNYMLLSDAITFLAFRSLICSMGIIIPDGHCDKETQLNVGFSPDSS